MYDVHSHILPGVDDGAKTVEDFTEMARVAAESGTRVILATPHRKDVTERSSVDCVTRLVDEMNARLRDLDIDLTLLLGMENHLDLDLPCEVSAGRALPMNGPRYILVEMPFFGRPNYVEEVLFELQLQGLTPVLAHPERIEAFQTDPELLASFVERGMLSQITAGSVAGAFGQRVRKFTATLFRRGLVHVLASDAHFPSGPRSPELPGYLEAAVALVGAERVRAMVTETPKAITENRPVEVDPPRTVTEPRSWFRFWRRG